MNKKFLLILIIALMSATPFCFAKDGGKKVPRTAINSLVNEFRHYDEFESINLGKFMTSIIKKAGVISLSADNDMDNEEKEQLKLVFSAMKSVNGMTIVDFEDCSPEVRRKFNLRMGKLLEGVELLMSAKDDDDSVYIYGCVTGDGTQVRDLVLFSPDDGTLLCLYGTLEMSAVGQLVNAAE